MVHESVVGSWCLTARIQRMRACDLLVASSRCRHPNVYKDGKVCISILHEAKADEFNTQEKMSEKCE